MSLVRVRSERHARGRWWTATCQTCSTSKAGWPMQIHHPTRGFVRHLSQQDALRTALSHVRTAHGEPR